MGLTAAVKNLFGFVVGTAKAQCHLRFSDPHSFADMLVDLALYIKPTISIVDGIYSMDREGPSSGRVVNTKFLAASDEPFTLDYLLAKHFGIPESRVYTVSASLKRNLIDLAPDIKGSLPAYEKFELPERSRIDTSSKAFSFARNMLTALPYYDKEVCKKCYECLENCPPQVIRKDETGFPVLADEKNCIRCYCCIELCPYGAAKLNYPLLLRVFKNFF
jgi:NAD-dependent dihydropyrimidine dehydrogenase PreA subunit